MASPRRRAEEGHRKSLRRTGVGRGDREAGRGLRRKVRDSEVRRVQRCTGDSEMELGPQQGEILRGRLSPGGGRTEGPPGSLGVLPTSGSSKRRDDSRRVRVRVWKLKQRVLPEKRPKQHG